ncbi:phosphatase PAP2 family protein [Cryobacterium tagatosivorans]|uniref:Phosphatase PAP2 family protein n=1 Tax=Cryobacterium tagatosivorans TaxID=1259199 RepID=A0A4R8UE18_9MICO|nr:phosphatase PAP2 family protein [Cryobacterium tagatosivorans]TFB51322.1 phosphatase PAP2 family protein [Cryobacterium tagatosivorans]
MSQSSSTETSRRPRWVQNYLSEESPPVQPARTGWFIAAAMLVVLGATAFFLVLNGVLNQQGLTLLDEPVRAWMVEHRSEGWTTVMVIIAEVSGPIGMPIVVAVFIALWVWRSGHAWRVLVLALAMLTGMSLALLIARLVGRSRPPEEFMLIGVDPSFSFPSGHVLGVADFLIVGGYLVVSRGRSWGAAVLCAVVAIVGVGLVALTRLYLGYHWLTDIAASVSLSLCVLGLAIALDTWRPLRHPPEAPTEEALSPGTNRV